MNKHLLIVPILFLMTIQSCTNTNKDIPDVKEISEVIYQTIIQDSLNISWPINLNLGNRYIYELEKDSVLGYIPSPPGDKKGEPFVFSRYLGDTSVSLGFSPDDSIFISNQILLNRDIVIDTNFIPDSIKFENIPVMNYKKQNLYVFLIPIFNKNRTRVIVEYEYRSVCCGYGVIVFFQKVNNKWIKINSFGTWTT